MEGGSHTKLEYIEFVDMAYIDTGYIPTDNTAFEFETAFNEDAQCWYGAISTNPAVYSRFHGGAENASKRLCIYLRHDTSAIQKRNDNLYHMYYISKALCKLDGIEGLGNLTIPKIPIYIGRRNSENVSSTEYYTTNRCRYAKIYENGKLVRHYIPVLRNGTYCMYEQIQGKYYYNAAGVGYFTGG